MVLPSLYHVTAPVISAIVLCVGYVPTEPQAIAVIAYLIRNTRFVSLGKTSRSPSTFIYSRYT